MKIIIDASNISPEVLVWLKLANDGHYYIERKPNRFGSSVDRFQVSIAFAEKLQVMSTEQAWFTMEKFVGIGVCG